MKYQVIKEFMDLQDKNHIYKAGDTYPREGQEPTEERIAELIGSTNRQKQPLIGAVEEPGLQKEAEELSGEDAADETKESEKTTAKKTKKGS